MLNLWAEARSEHASTADQLEEVERLVGESPAALLVAEKDEEIVGALIAAWDGWRGICTGSLSAMGIDEKASGSR